MIEVVPQTAAHQFANVFLGAIPMDQREQSLEVLFAVLLLVELDHLGLCGQLLSRVSRGVRLRGSSIV